MKWVLTWRALIVFWALAMIADALLEDWVFFYIALAGFIFSIFMLRYAKKNLA